MKTFFKQKKCGKRVLSFVFACCMLAGLVKTYPLLAQTKKADASNLGVLCENNAVSLTETDQGVKVTYEVASEGWYRIETLDTTYNAASGIHVEITDITSPAQDFTFALCFGDSGLMWTDKAGYMLLYGKNGHFEIFPTNVAHNWTCAARGQEVVEVEREPLGDSLALDLKLEGSDYVITVNGDTYTIPAVNPTGSVENGTAISDTKNLRFGFGIESEISQTTGDVADGKIPKDSSFVIAELGSAYQTPDIDNTEVGTMATTATAEEFTYNGYAAPQQTEAGVTFSHTAQTVAGAHVNTVKGYDTEKGVLLSVSGINSVKAGENYKIALAIGGQSDQWTDKDGYVMTYGKDGAFSITKTTDGKKIVSIKREALGDELTVYFKKQSGEKDYVLTVNGKSYTIYDADSKILATEGDNKDKVFFGLGIVDGADDATFTVNKISDAKFVPQKVGGYWSTANMQLTDNGNNVSVNYRNNPVVSNEQIYTAEAYDVSKGIHVEVPSIHVQEGTDCSFAISLGNDSRQWYNKDGYMIVYGTDGYFGVFKSQNGSQVPADAGNSLVTLKREGMRTPLSMDIKLVNGAYILTVNGCTYTLGTNYTEGLYCLKIPCIPLRCLLPL